MEASHDHPLLRGLNPPQQEAVQHTQGPLLILAGAGSGKTTVITRRIAWLVEEAGVHPASILAVTFTNKAAEEMRERVARLVSVPVEQLWVSTFHSFCTRLLRREGDRTPVGRSFVIFDPSDQKSLVKQVLAELKLSEKQFHPRKVLECISDWKNRCLLPEEAQEDALDAWTRKTLEAYRLYQQGLTNHRACDFDDLLLHAERLLRLPVMQEAYAQKFRYVLVDEYQDTNYAQYKLVQHLAGLHKNLCVVGDEDQSIYGWRGADIRNILDFQRDFPGAKQIKLEQNYRSTQAILDAASTVIANNSQRLGKTLWTDLGHGERLSFRLLDDGRAEAEYVARRILEQRAGDPQGRVAVLYRANWQSRPLEEALRSQNLAYKLVGGTKFYERQEIKDLISYLRLATNAFDLTSFRRCVNTPSRGIGPTTLAKIEAAIPAEGTPLEGVAAVLKAGGFSGRSQREMLRFHDLFAKAEVEKRAQPLSGFIRWMLHESGLLQALVDEDTLEAKGRIENLEEFLSAASELDGLGLDGFLDRITLMADADEVEQDARITLMTIHCAKGLEFPTVFLVGMEEDVFPNRMAKEDDGLEEERRLFYVAITRAQRKLFMSGARRRAAFGGPPTLGMPSRFLKEVPTEALDQPIRWGTEMFQAGQGGWTPAPARGGGGGSVAGELSRIRSMFSQVKAQAPAAPETSEPEDTPTPPEPPVSGDAWTVGTRVRSPRFGRGVITGATGRGDMLTYTVRFAESGEKRIVAKYGALEKE